MYVTLTFINNSNDTNPQQIVIFQSTATEANSMQAIARKVLHTGSDTNTSFTLSLNAEQPTVGFKPTIWVGAIPDVQEGGIVDSSTLSNVYTQLSLEGVASADLVMTGDGTGELPFHFHLDNVQMTESVANKLAAMPTHDVHLNFINKSEDKNNTEIVIFQKNTGPGSNLAVAWLVIQNCGPGSNRPFTYPAAITVSASDAYGNITPALQAEYGQLFEMVGTSSGNQLQLAEAPGAPNEIQLRNGLQKGVINANVYKDGKLLALKTGIVPQQRAAFSFQATIWIGAVSQIEEGAVMNSAIVMNINTELDLLSIKRADIVMTGGGAGTNSKPFRFELENIVYQ